MGVAGLATKFPFWIPLDAEMSAKKSLSGAVSSRAAHVSCGVLAASAAGVPSGEPPPAALTADDEQAGAAAQRARPRKEARMVGRFMPTRGVARSLTL